VSALRLFFIWLAEGLAKILCCAKLVFMLFTISLYRRALKHYIKPMQPMRLHWAPRHGGWARFLFLPDTPCA